MSVFTVESPIRFAHCDPAGIAYYPKLFEIGDAVIEDWTEHVLNVSRSEMHFERKLGLPTVTLDATFHAPARLGEMLRFTLSVIGVGNSSVDLCLTAHRGEEPRFTIRYRQVLITMSDAASCPWPHEWRDALSRVSKSGKVK